MNIVPALEQHYARILAINESALPHVNSLSVADLTALAAESTYFKVVLIDEKVCGFLLVMEQGADYQSLNYQWFSRQYDSFLYVDRIVIAAASVGTGLGTALYKDLIESIGHRAPVLTCEVNLKPPNAPSIEYHRKLGFEQIGTQDTEGGKKTVSWMARQLAGPD